MEASNKQPGFHGKQVRVFFVAKKKCSKNPTVGIDMDSLLFYGSRSDPQPVPGHRGSTILHPKRTKRTTEVLSMKWVDDVVLGAPWKVSEELLTTMILR